MGLTFSLVTQEYNSDGYPLEEPTEIFSINITHNCSKMMLTASENLYDALYNSHGVEAWTIIDQLTDGLHWLYLRSSLVKLEAPKNGWGSYEGLVSFVCKVLEACILYPKSTISICR